MLWALSVPAEHERGPQYFVSALSAMHRAFRGRKTLELLLARQGSYVGLFCRAAAPLAPVVTGQLLAAYPDLRIAQLDETALAPRADAVWFSARLRLTPGVASLLSAEHFLDREQRQLADPLAALLGTIASGKGTALRPMVSLAIRPVGQLHRWRLARRARRKRDGAAVAKTALPLWTVEVRLLVQAPRAARIAAMSKLHELAAVFAQYLPPGAARWKLSRVRTGRLRNGRPPFGRTYLTPAELALLWHPPTTTVRTPQLRVNECRELEPPPPGVLPALAHHPHLALLGRTAFRERRETFGMLPEDRFRHLYAIGQTGTGKSTLLLNLAAADIAAGRSIVLLDVHGDLCEHLLSIVPPRRTNDIIVFDPSDPHAASYNPLACSDKRQRPLVASAVVTSFRRLFGSSYGPRLDHILRNCVLTLLDNPATTLLSLQRLLNDDSYRKQLVGRVSDEVVRSFWLEEWAKWTPQFRAEALAPVQNKVGALVTHPLLRNVLGDPAAKLDLRDVLDSGKVLLCNLSKGRVGDDVATLLGSLLVAGVQLAAGSRAEQPEADRVPAFLFLDEFQNYLTSETIPTLLAEMRKYRLAVILAHQHLGQLDEATAAAVFGNAGTLLAFRLGQDAETFAEQLGGDLLPSDLRALPKYHAYIRLLIDGMPNRPFSMTTLPPPRPNQPRVAVVRRVSRQRFGSSTNVRSFPAASVV